MGELKSSGKPFEISKWKVWEAWEKVRSNKGAAGVDGCSIEEFEKDLENSLYKIWNRMSSGSYFPPPVRVVEIPRSHGKGTRTLGVPTVSDRIAQTVVAGRLEEKVEAIFHPDSYGYRPGRSALDAVEVCRRRCWKYDWVIDLDIEKFFDSVPRADIVRLVEMNTDAVWVVMYVRRWLDAPLQMLDGSVLKRDRGTAQGSAVSPVLANLFLHYAFDEWMAREFPSVPFERYVDDAVVHCVSEAQARMVLAAIGARMEQVGLRLHPQKTRIVYLRDDRRRGSSEHAEFTFLGFTFRQRRARDKHGKIYYSVLPAISDDAQKKISAEVRSWRLHLRTRQQLADLARDINSVVRGWMNYYGAFYRSAMYRILARINAYLVRWLRKKYKRLKGRKKAMRAWRGATTRCPRLFAHWAWITSVPAVW